MTRPKREKKKSAKWHMARAVACPSCKALPDQPCHYTYFEPPKGAERFTPTMHRERYEAGVVAHDLDTPHREDGKVSIHDDD